jgi:hypothetical protein
MERQLLNRAYLREQFNTYWPRVQSVMPARYHGLLNRIETYARDFMGSTSKAAAPKRRAPRKTTRKAHA